MADISYLLSKLREAEKVIRPFAEVGKTITGADGETWATPMTVGDLRLASAFLTGNPPQAADKE